MKIKEYMNSLRLNGMSTLWNSLTQSRQHLQLDLHDGLELLLQAEREDRQQRRTARLIYQARFRYQVDISLIPCHSFRFKPCHFPNAIIVNYHLMMKV